jgi:hypothetical protein
MVASVGMIESEMGYRAVNPFKHTIFPYFILFMMKLLQLRALFKKGGGSESFNPGY